jgi:hypothetical protein
MSALMVWLMPWRAAAKIRQQDEVLMWLIRAIASKHAREHPPALRVIHGGN